MDPLRVLVIEDDRHIAAILADILLRDGMDVRICHRAGTVTSAMLAWADAALVDLSLPDSPPSQTVRRIPEWHRHASVVVLTGYADDPDRARDLGAIGVPVVAKPPDASVLISHVRAAAHWSAVRRGLLVVAQHIGRVLLRVGVDEATAEAMRDVLTDLGALAADT